MNFAKHWAATLDDYVIDLAWSPDGTLLAAASAAGGITLYDAATGAVKHTLAGHENGTNCLAWMPRSGSQLLLATGGQDGCVRIWDAVTGDQASEVKLGNAWIEHLDWPPAGQLLFATAGRKLVALNSDGSTAHTFPDASKTISSLANHHDSCRLAVASFGQVRVFDTATFALVKEFSYNNAILALTWSPDGRWLVAGCHDNAVHLWAPAEDLELHMSGYETKLQELSFSYDSRWLATGGGRDACVWDCSGPGPEGREPLLLPQKERTTAVAFQNRHNLLATAAADGEFSLWSPTRQSPLLAEVRLPSAATKFAWRPDDSLLAVGTTQGKIYVFKLAA